MLPGNRGVSCGPSLSQRPAGYLLSLWKKTLHKTTRGKIRGDIIHDLNLADDGIIRWVKDAMSGFLFAHSKHAFYHDNRGWFTT